MAGTIGPRSAGQYNQLNVVNQVLTSAPNLTTIGNPIKGAYTFIGANGYDIVTLSDTATTTAQLMITADHNSVIIQPTRTDDSGQSAVDLHLNPGGNFPVNGSGNTFFGNSLAWGPVYFGNDAGSYVGLQPAIGDASTYTFLFPTVISVPPRQYQFMTVAQIESGAGNIGEDLYQLQFTTLPLTDSLAYSIAGGV